MHTFLSETEARLRSFRKKEPEHYLSESENGRHGLRRSRSGPHRRESKRRSTSSRRLRFLPSKKHSRYVARHGPDIPVGSELLQFYPVPPYGVSENLIRTPQAYGPALGGFQYADVTAASQRRRGESFVRFTSPSPQGIRYFSDEPPSLAWASGAGFPYTQHSPMSAALPMASAIHEPAPRLSPSKLSDLIMSLSPSATPQQPMTQIQHMHHSGSSALPLSGSPYAGSVRTQSPLSLAWHTALPVEPRGTIPNGLSDLRIASSSPLHSNHTRIPSFGNSPEEKLVVHSGSRLTGSPTPNHVPIRNDGSVYSPSPPQYSNPPAYGLTESPPCSARSYVNSAGTNDSGLEARSPEIWKNSSGLGSGLPQLSMSHSLLSPNSVPGNNGAAENPGDGAIQVDLPSLKKMRTYWLQNLSQKNSVDPRAWVAGGMSDEYFDSVRKAWRSGDQEIDEILLAPPLSLSSILTDTSVAGNSQKLLVERVPNRNQTMVKGGLPLERKFARPVSKPHTWGKSLAPTDTNLGEEAGQTIESEHEEQASNTVQNELEWWVSEADKSDTPTKKAKKSNWTFWKKSKKIETSASKQTRSRLDTAKNYADSRPATNWRDVFDFRSSAGEDTGPPIPTSVGPAVTSDVESVVSKVAETVISARENETMYQHNDETDIDLTLTGDVPEQAHLVATEKPTEDLNLPVSGPILTDGDEGKPSETNEEGEDINTDSASSKADREDTSTTGVKGSRFDFFDSSILGTIGGIFSGGASTAPDAQPSDQKSDKGAQVGESPASSKDEIRSSDNAASESRAGKTKDGNDSKNSSETLRSTPDWTIDRSITSKYPSSIQRVSDDNEDNSHSKISSDNTSANHTPDMLSPMVKSNSFSPTSSYSPDPFQTLAVPKFRAPFSFSDRHYTFQSTEFLGPAQEQLVPSISSANMRKSLTNATSSSGSPPSNQLTATKSGRGFGPAKLADTSDSNSVSSGDESFQLATDQAIVPQIPFGSHQSSDMSSGASSDKYSTQPPSPETWNVPLPTQDEVMSGSESDSFESVESPNDNKNYSVSVSTSKPRLISSLPTTSEPRRESVFTLGPEEYNASGSYLPGKRQFTTHLSLKPDTGSGGRKRRNSIGTSSYASQESSPPTSWPRSPSSSVYRKV